MGSGVAGFGLWHKQTPAKTKRGGHEDHPSCLCRSVAGFLTTDIEFVTAPNSQAFVPTLAG